MKGLFVKDIALMKNNKRLLGIIFFTIIFLMITGVNSSFLMGYVPFICCTLTMGTISYDDMKMVFRFFSYYRFPVKNMCRKNIFWDFLQEVWGLF